MTDCTRDKSVANHDYSDVLDAREACGCLVCAHDLADAKRKLLLAEQTTLFDNR